MRDKIAEVAESFHQAVERKIDPTFDSIERFTDRHPSMTAPINLALIGFFPVWIVTAMVVKSIKNMND